MNNKITSLEENFAFDNFLWAYVLDYQLTQLNSYENLSNSL